MRAWASGFIVAILIATSAWSDPLEETFITLDEGTVKPFMERLTQVIEGGFGPGQRDGVAKLIDGMKPDDELFWQFSVTYDGRAIPLRVHAVMGHRRDATVDFLTSPELADRIQLERNVFLDKLDQ